MDVILVPRPLAITITITTVACSAPPTNRPKAHYHSPYKDSAFELVTCICNVKQKTFK